MAGPARGYGAAPDLLGPVERRAAEPVVLALTVLPESDGKVLLCASSCCNVLPFTSSGRRRPERLLRHISPALSDEPSSWQPACFPIPTVCKELFSVSQGKVLHRGRRSPPYQRAVWSPNWPNAACRSERLLLVEEEGVGEQSYYCIGARRSVRGLGDGALAPLGAPRRM